MILFDRHDWSIDSQQEAFTFLKKFGVTKYMSNKIYDFYQENFSAVLKDDPYRLSHDIKNIKFDTVDKIALSFGVRQDSPLRISAWLMMFLKKETSAGHCGIFKEKLLKKMEEALKFPCYMYERVINHLRTLKKFVVETFQGKEVVFSKELAHAEHVVANKLIRLKKGSLPWDYKRLDFSLLARSGSLGLSEDQKSEVINVLSSKVSVLSGGPGVGKTTVVKSILRVLNDTGVRVHLAAPTGKAAKRLAESTSRSAQTLHSLLESMGPGCGFRKNATNLLEPGIFIVDETSMVSLSLMRALLEALPSSCVLLLIGDVDQLPSVESGQVLRDIIESKTIDVYRLTSNFRQSPGSSMILLQFSGQTKDKRF